MPVAPTPTTHNDAKPFAALATDTSSSHWSRFLACGLPVSRDEDWLYSDLRALRRERFVQPDAPSDSIRNAIRASLDELVHDTNALRLVLVNGSIDDTLSNCNGWPKPLSIASHENTTASDGATDPFVLLNYAVQPTTLSMAVADGASIDAPLYVAYVTTNKGHATVSAPRIKISVGKGSSLTMHTVHLGEADTAHLACPVESVALAKNARLTGTVEAIDMASSYLVHTRTVHQDAASEFASASLRSGGPVSRDTITVRLTGEDASASLGGLTLLDESRRADTHIVIHHDAPKCQSEQQFRGILGDASASGFTGRVVVKQDAQRTAAEQANHNLLLTDDAVANTRPQLEIYADDVRCTHGATIGRLDEDALFYLRARGIDKVHARSLLMEAFGRDALAGVEDERLREAMGLRIRAHIARVAAADQEEHRA